MFTKIKVFFVAAAGIVMAILYGLLQKEKAERADEHEKIAEHSQKATKDATDALVNGLTKEQEAKNAKVDTDPANRTHFS